MVMVTHPQQRQHHKAPSLSSTSSIITIDLTNHPPKTPLGIILAPANIIRNHDTHMKVDSLQHSTTIVLIGYDSINSNSNIIQKSNMVRIGDVLTYINGVNISQMSFKRVLDLLKCLIYGSVGSNMNITSNRRNGLISLGFENGRIYYSKYCQANNGNLVQSSTIAGFHHRHQDKQWNIVGRTGGDNGTSMNQQQLLLYSFTSFIHRARLCQEEEQGKQEGEGDTEDANDNCSEKNSTSKTFVQYEIKCILSIKQLHDNNMNNHYQYQQQQQQQDQITWSVWKRYTDFQNLDSHIRKTFHYTKLENIMFPSKHSLLSYFMFGKGPKTRTVKSAISHQRSVNHNNSGGGTISSGNTLCEKFIQKRRNEIEHYWQALQTVQGLFDFGDPMLQHRYSYKMAEFLDVKREYFTNHNSGDYKQQKEQAGGTGTRNRSRLVGGGESVGSGSRPTVIHVDGKQQVEGNEHILDESTISVLSNSQGGMTSSLNNTPQRQVITGAAVETRSPDLSVTSEVLSGVGDEVDFGGNGGAVEVGRKKTKRRRRRRQVAAKSAFERRFLDDL